MFWTKAKIKKIYRKLFRSTKNIKIINFLVNFFKSYCFNRTGKHAIKNFYQMSVGQMIFDEKAWEPQQTNQINQVNEQIF